MKKYYFVIFFSAIAIILSSFKQDVKEFKNLSFDKAIDDYCKYLDTMDYRKNFDFIYLKAFKKEDCVEFKISLYGGAYPFINGKEKIIDFINYKGYDILLTGYFPNGIVDIEKNKELDVMEDIVKQRYRKEYDKFIQEKFAPAPLIYDYMNLTLVFKKNKLVVYKREFY